MLATGAGLDPSAALGYERLRCGVLGAPREPVSLRPTFAATALFCAGFTSLFGLVACTASVQVAAGQGAAWPKQSKRWFERATRSYAVADLDDAQLAVDKVLADVDHDEVRLLAARVAIAQLDWPRVQELLEGVDGNDAKALRGRAYWYASLLDKAADELESLLADPDVVDPWAQDVARLARLGAGRTPFRFGGPRKVAPSPMYPSRRGAWLLVPVTVNGEDGLGLVATNMTEVVVDSSGDKSPEWVSLGFGGGAVELKDVPALRRDLSGYSKQVDAPVKVLLGVNLLRRLNATFDYQGSQFVVRRYPAPIPPGASTLPLHWLKGGGMVMRASFGEKSQRPSASFLVDSMMPFPVALDSHGLGHAGVKKGDLRPLPNGQPQQWTELPLFTVAQIEIPRLFSVLDENAVSQEKGLGVDLDGVVGAGLISGFRVTFAPGGRALWLEENVVEPAPPIPADGDVGGLDMPEFGPGDGGLQPPGFGQPGPGPGLSPGQLGPGQLGPGQPGPGQLSPGQLDPGGPLQ